MNSNPSSGGVVLARRAGKVLVLTINRPAACNAMSRAVYGGIIGHMKEAETDPEVNCVVLTGQGKFFSAGVDLKERQAEQIAPHDFFESAMFSDDRPGHFYCYLSRYRKPLITAINGPALGGGAITAMLGDISVMASDAYLSLPEIERGVTADGATLVLPRLTSRAQAMYLVLTGRKCLAARAESIGLVSMVVAPDEVMTTALELAEDIARRSGVAVRLFKTALQAGPWGDRVEADTIRQAMLALAQNTPERLANTRAAVESISSASKHSPS